ncbi:MAG: hypothetical protein RDU89_03645 [bacterium]|nr:hypothetical protein [bacterium]
MAPETAGKGSPAGETNPAAGGIDGVDDQAATYWLLEAGSPPVRYRALRDILGRQPDGKTRQAILAYEPARQMAARQQDEGRPAAHRRLPGRYP